MIITNKLNLPQQFVNYVSNEYKFEDKRYSVTALLKGYKEIILTRRHYDEMEEDVADRIWTFFGSAVHKVIEDSQEAKDELKETKIAYTFGNGYTLSGQQDLYSESLKRITDYKTGTVWKVVYGEWEDYKKQLLYYGLLFRKIGFEVDNAEIVMLLKDWSKTKAKFDSNYPHFPVFIKHFEFTDDDFIKAENEIINKFNVLDELSKLADDEIIECSKEERWATNDTYALMKNNAKRAVKICETEDEAKTLLETGKGDYIEVRKGEDKKCMEYCPCAKWCNYWREKYGE